MMVSAMKHPFRTGCAGVAMLLYAVVLGGIYGASGGRLGGFEVALHLVALMVLVVVAAVCGSLAECVVRKVRHRPDDEPDT